MGCCLIADTRQLPQIRFLAERSVLGLAVGIRKRKLAMTPRVALRDVSRAFCTHPAALCLRVSDRRALWALQTPSVETQKRSRFWRSQFSSILVTCEKICLVLNPARLLNSRRFWNADSLWQSTVIQSAF